MKCKDGDFWFMAVRFIYETKQKKEIANNFPFLFKKYVYCLA